MLSPMHICKSDFLRASLHLRALLQALNSSQQKPLVQGFLETSFVGNAAKQVSINDTYTVTKKLRQNLIFWLLLLSEIKCTQLFFLCRKYFYINISSMWEIITSYGNTEPIALYSVSDSLLWWILKLSRFSKGATSCWKVLGLFQFLLQIEYDSLQSTFPLSRLLQFLK